MGSFFNTIIESLESRKILIKTVDARDRDSNYLTLEVSDEILNSLKSEYINRCKLPMLVKPLNWTVDSSGLLPQSGGYLTPGGEQL